MVKTENRMDYKKILLKPVMLIHYDSPFLFFLGGKRKEGKINQLSYI